MNQFVHNALGHFLMGPLDSEGNDLGGLPGDDDTDDDQEDDDTDDDADGDDAADDADSEGEMVVTLGGKALSDDEEEGDEDGKPAPKWVKEVRKDNREKAKRIRELEELVRKQEVPKSAPVLGKKPSLSDDDIDYDEEKFEQSLSAWYDKKREIEQHEHQQQQAEQQQKTEWEGRLTTYQTAKTGLKVKDFDDAEENVRNLLNVTQQGIIIQGADNSALIVYALGKNPKKAAELAGITDAVKFAFAIAKLETQLKVQSKKAAPPPPEKEVRGQGRITGAVDSTLERLRAEAEKTGDLSKVHAYKREQKRKAKG